MCTYYSTAISLLYNVVVSDSSLITGGHAISKVRLMDEENEVNDIGLHVNGTVMCSPV